MDSEISIIAFAQNNSINPDAFVVINMEDNEKEMNLTIFGNKYNTLKAFRSTEDEKELNSALGSFSLNDGVLNYKIPAKSVTTFSGN